MRHGWRSSCTWRHGRPPWSSSSTCTRRRLRTVRRPCQLTACQLPGWCPHPGRPHVAVPWGRPTAARGNTANCVCIDLLGFSLKLCEKRYMHESWTRVGLREHNRPQRHTTSTRESHTRSGIEITQTRPYADRQVDACGQRTENTARPRQQSEGWVAWDARGVTGGEAVVACGRQRH